MPTDTPPISSGETDTTTPATQLQAPDTDAQVEQPNEDEALTEARILGRSAASTAPLPELAVQSAPLLAEGSIVGNRYQVLSVLGPGALLDTHIYDVIDLQGHLGCWACGSSNSEPGDTYCVDCGAQITGRHYRLQEIPTSAGPIPEALLANRVPGVGHVHDTYTSEAGPTYLVWEEAYGRTLSSWLSGSANADPSMQQATEREQVEEDQAAVWLTQVAQVLASLHAEGITGCSLKADNLLVQPGDRLLLLEPVGCRDTQGSTEEQAVEQAEDVRALAAELERWYLAVRPYNGTPLDAPVGIAQAAQPGEDGALVADADESTGYLAGDQNPNLALVLSRAREGEYPTANDFVQALAHLREASGPQPNIQLWSGRASDVGQVRPLNEDSVLTLEANVLEQDGRLPVALYVVADGMGGHESGEVASSIAVRSIGSIVNSALIAPMVAGEAVARDANTCGALLRQAVIEANRRIANLAQDRHSDLGTTIVAALVVGGHVSVANVGDSRAYVWQGGQLTPLTRDHSLVAQLVTAGQISPDEIYTHPRRNEIYRALGDARLSEDEVDLFSHHLKPGDGLLLCSDGLWDFVRDPDIAATIVEHQDASPQATCDTLVEQANAAGGEDNISVVLVRVMRDVVRET